MNSQGESQTSVNLGLNSFRLNFLRLVGLYPLSANVNIVLKTAYYVYWALFMCISAVVILCRCVYLFRGGTLLDGLSSGTSLTIAYTLGFLKSSIYYCTWNKNLQVHNAVEIGWKMIYLRKNDHNVYRIIRETEATTRLFTFASCLIMLVTYVFFSVYPILTYYMNSSVIGTELPIKIWLPIELNSWMERVTVYIVERIVNFYLCCSIVALINLYVFLLTLISAEFKILKIDFMNFADEYTDLYTDETGYDKLISFRLKRTVRNHQALLG